MQGDGQIGQSDYSCMESDGRASKTNAEDRCSVIWYYFIEGLPLYEI
jgi:hypothetical protein